TGDQAALDEQVRIVPPDLAVLAGTGFGFIGIDDEVARPPVLALFRHERPLQAGRETRAAASALAGRLHLVDERIASALKDRLGIVPGAAPARALEAPVVEAVEILEDAVLVFEHSFF